MLHSPEGEENWLLNEISGFNVPVKRRCFHKEASGALRESLDEAHEAQVGRVATSDPYEGRLRFGINDDLL
jgi:hypothetical protein